MKRLASEVLRDLEIRVARLERQVGFGFNRMSKSSSHNKSAVLSGLASKVEDFYVYLKRELPGEKERKEILSKIVSDLEDELINSIESFQGDGWVGKTKGRVKCSIQSGQLVISISVDTLNNEDSITLKISEMSDLIPLKMYVWDLKTEWTKDSWTRRQVTRRIPFEVWDMILRIITETLEMPLFLPMLQGDLATLADRVDASLRKEFEKKFWDRLERYSSVAAKVLKAIAKIGVGALVVGLCISVFMLIPWGLIGNLLVMLLKSIVAALAIMAGGYLGTIIGGGLGSLRVANEIPDDPEERLELFLEVLEQEGIA